MSVTTLQFALRIGGVLTDPDGNSVVFSDSTGMLAVRRTDNNAAVNPPAVNTALSRISTGVYQYALTDPALGLTYQWFAKFSVQSAVSFVEFTTAGTPAAPPCPPAPDASTDAGMLALVNTAIADILGGRVSAYMIDGRSATYLDLYKLVELQRRLRLVVGRTNNGLFSVGAFRRPR